MRILCIFLFLLLSQQALANFQLGAQFTTQNGVTGATQCQNYLIQRNASDPRMPMKCISYQWWYDSVLCEAGQTYNLVGQACSTPCGTDTINNFTSAGQSFVACVSNCQVSQVGDAVCHGSGTNPDSYCTANYKKTGKYCPDVGQQVEPCTTCAASSSSLPASSSQAAVSSVAASSLPAVTSSASSAATAVSSAAAAASSASGSGSTSSLGGGSGGGDGGNDGGGTGGGDNGGGDSSSGSNSSSGSGSGSGSVSDGITCEAAPVCTGDILQCNIIFQAYKLRCSGKSLTPRTEGEPTLDLEQKLADTKQRYTDEFNVLKTRFSNSLALSIAGGSGALASNVQTLKGAQVELGIAARSDFFSLIGALFMFAAAILSAYIILEK